MSNQMSRLVAAVLSAWFCFLVLDFLVHAVLLASWWRTTESYWLPPAMLLRMIPLAYASFVIYCAMLVWLQIRLIGPQPGIVSSLGLGAIVGAAFGCSSVLATYSVFAMPKSALLIWPASFLVESLGAVIASSLVIRATRPWRRVLVIFVLALLLFVFGVGLQNVLFSGKVNRLGMLLNPVALRSS